MKLALFVSTLLGLAWYLALFLILPWARFIPGEWLCSMTAGAAAGAFTIWSRQKTGGRESILFGVMTLPVAILAYWCCLVTLAVTLPSLLKLSSSWTWENSRDSLALLLGATTVWFGIAFFPGCFICRYIVWRVFCRNHPGTKNDSETSSFADASSWHHMPHSRTSNAPARPESHGNLWRMPNTVMQRSAPRPAADHPDTLDRC